MIENYWMFLDYKYVILVPPPPLLSSRIGFHFVNEEVGRRKRYTSLARRPPTKKPKADQDTPTSQPNTGIVMYKKKPKPKH